MAVTEGKYDIVVTYSLDRISRDVSNMSRTVKTLETYGVSLVSVSENLDFSGPMGPVLMTLFSALAEMQDEVIPLNAAEGGS